MALRKCACIDTLYTELDWLDRFQAAKEDGFEAVEFWDWRVRDLEQTRAAAEKAGIAISGFNGDADYSLVDPAHREPYLAELKKSIAAAKLGQEMLKNLGFMTTTRVIFDPINWHTSGPLFDQSTVIPPFREHLPWYNISDSPLRKLDNEPLAIIAPTDPPSRGRMNLISTVLSPVLMAGTLMAVRYVAYSGSASGPGMILMSGSMALASVVAALANGFVYRREYKRSLREWREQYQSYIRQLLERIQNKQAEDVKTLQALYPQAQIPNRVTEGAEDLVSKALEINGEIFGRGQEHPGFLQVRVGVSTDRSELVRSVFPIEGEKKEVVFASVRYNNIRNIEGYPFVIHLPGEDPGPQGGAR